MLAISAGGGRYRDSAWAVCCLGPLQGGRAVLAVTSRQSASGHRQASRPAGMVRGLMSRIAREPRIVPSLATCRVFDSDGQEGRQAGGQAGGNAGCGQTRRQAGGAPMLLMCVNQAGRDPSERRLQACTLLVVLTKGAPQ
jgi:hypothetical protein